jgi:hypothetical protein
MKTLEEIRQGLCNIKRCCRNVVNLANYLSDNLGVKVDLVHKSGLKPRMESEFWQKSFTCESFVANLVTPHRESHSPEDRLVLRSNQKMIEDWIILQKQALSGNTLSCGIRSRSHYS